MTALAHQLQPFSRKQDQNSWDSIQCPAPSSLYPSQYDSQHNDSISFQCPFSTLSSVASREHHAVVLPTSHPIVSRSISPLSRPSYRQQEVSSGSSGVKNASYILPVLPNLIEPRREEEHLVTQGNFSHLYSDDLDRPSMILQQTLEGFRASSSRYATERYDIAFNWTDLEGLPLDMHREWYCVVFRSKRKASSSNLSLYSADRAAHYEAIEGGGLIMYWYGEPDDQGQNLATCVWQSRQQALEGTKGPRHIHAMRQAAKAYESFTLERWVLRKERGKLRLSLVPWIDGEVNLGSSVQRGRSRETKKLSL
ncbi:hypothetical protein BD324DRAFT_173468 [Kockovaella imperatae]|uniref:Uncharacterized protein n=1 Tax=Kockovaella imperatae TaxID=4999 RepID=A0A1Y1UAY6_9TREE|nr:hypothetical protein BD324DRAFT_173468 [Kockovaella imperatae]ORX34235.1 hypothetical protein BD324DRAFT_173468 [Kockovaella imperatae]